MIRIQTILYEDGGEFMHKMYAGEALISMIQLNDDGNWDMYEYREGAPRMFVGECKSRGEWLDAQYPRFSGYVEKYEVSTSDFENERDEWIAKYDAFLREFDEIAKVRVIGAYQNMRNARMYRNCEKMLGCLQQIRRAIYSEAGYANATLTVYGLINAYPVRKKCKLNFEK